MAWEYKVAERATQLKGEELVQFLNDLGKDDWELISYTIGTLAIFKRKLTGPSE